MNLSKKKKWNNSSYDNVRGLEWENQAGREEGEGNERGNMGREQN